MAIIISDPLSMAASRATANVTNQMAQPTTVLGSRTKYKDSEPPSGLMEESTLANGSQATLMDWELIRIATAGATRVNMRKVTNMEKVPIVSLTEERTQASGKRELCMGGSCMKTN